MIPDWVRLLARGVLLLALLGGAVIWLVAGEFWHVVRARPRVGVALLVGAGLLVLLDGQAVTLMDHRRRLRDAAELGGGEAVATID